MATRPHAPELLLPAGTLERMRAAYDFGADAVYAGQPRYSLRARNNEFKLPQLEQGIQEAKARGRKFFVASNLIAHHDKLRTYLRDIEPVVAAGPDALIMADPGLIMQVKDRWPELPVHLSVQANTTNAAAVKFWHRAGVSRIILSRELSLDEVADIRQACPEVELEVFVHGALCIAYSGRCYLSGYFNRRDPNQGTCTNACRWGYHTHAADTDPNTGDAVARQAVVHWVAADEPAEALPTTHLMNSKDLRAVQHVARLVQIGVDSLKVEGRTKSRYYVARTAQVYRRAIDDAVAGRPFNPERLLDLDHLANRGYTAGLLEPQPMDGYQSYQTGYSVGERSQFVAEAVDTAETLQAPPPDAVGQWVLLETKNRFAVGDAVEVVHPAGNHTVRITALRDVHAQPVAVAQGSPVRVWAWLPVRAGGYRGAMLARLNEPADAAAVAAPRDSPQASAG
jgi:putative protease